jgi:hypothetical protein
MIIFLLFLLNDIREQPNITTVDVIELNHVYSQYGEAGLDQIILWNWTEYKYEDGRKELKRKPIGFMILDRDIHREKLTPEEWAKKNRKFQQAWDKKWGANNYRPKYNPKFLYSIYCPFYDYNRKMYCVLIPRGSKRVKIYGISYTESHTQFDPEVEARNLWPDYLKKDDKRLSY